MKSLFDPTRKTAGQFHLENVEKQADTDDITLLQREMQNEQFEQEIRNNVEKHKSIWPKTNFFPIVITRKCALPFMDRQYEHYHFSRLTCPTPDYDQMVFYYDWRRDETKLIWTLPARFGCLWLIQNRAQLSKDWQEILGYVYLFASGDLYKLALKLNNEKDIGDNRIVH